MAGGGGNAASGDFSFAGGRSATANFDGCFVWGDSNFVAGGLHCDAPNEVIMRAFCERDGYARIGFGECAGTVMPARTAVP